MIFRKLFLLFLFVLLFVLFCFLRQAFAVKPRLVSQFTKPTGVLGLLESTTTLGLKAINLETNLLNL